MIVKDKTYQMLYDFMLQGIKDSQQEQYKVILDQWITARNSIIDVFIETLEAKHQANYLNHQEQSMMEIFRCLDPKTRQRYVLDMKHTYEMECSRRAVK